MFRLSANLKKNDLLLALGALTILMSTASCAIFGGDDGYEDGYGAAAATPPQPDYVYYEFDDVPIPRELSREEKETYIIESPPMKSGLMVFSGGLDRPTLLEFFIQAMINTGWSVRSIFKAPRSLLIYEKSGRYCVICVAPGSFFKTKVEIWVTSSNSEALAPSTYNYGPSSSSFIE